MSLLVLLGAAGTCALSGIFPWISAEVVVVSAALALPPSFLPLVVVGCAVGQMVGKGGLYAVMRWAPERLPERAQAVLAKAEGLGERPVYLGGATLTGAASGLPPFYLVTLAAGAARLSFFVFVLAGLVGSLLRYSLVAWGADTLGGGG